MAEQGEDPEGVYVEHQYMCSECHQLFSTLEDVLIHQQIHTGVEGDAESVTIQDMSEMMGAEGQQYQCLECGALLLNPEELLQHQEMHMREAGMEVEHQELCEVLETEGGGGSEAVPVQYQCLDCLALFDSPDVWLEHRQTHSHSSTHSSTATETMEYVLQPDGTITPLNSVQNYILSEQQAGEILAQVLAQQQQQQRQQQLRQQQQQQQQQKRKLQQQQRKRQSVPKIAAKPPRSTLLPPVSASPGSATMHLQILTAQALADSSTTPRLQHAKLMPALLGSTAKLGILENGLQRVELRLAPGVQEIKMEHQQHVHLQQPQLKTEVMVIHPYECSECSLLFQTPEDFLQHQGVHFLGQDKESGDASGVMTGDEEERGIREDAAVKAAEEPRQPRQAEEKKAWCQRQQCDICKRTFTSVNRLAAHKRVHEQGTHECPECGKMFKKATTLQTHMRTHSGVARYLCVDCGHGFNTEMTLITHRKSHTADPLHKCLFCAKTFTNMTKFLYHRRTHIDRSGSTTAPVTMVPAHSKASPSTLAILQRARERREASRAQQEAMSTLLAPLTDVEMENMAVDTSAQGSQKASDEGEEERRGEKSSKDVATPSPAADSGPPQVEETSEMDVDEKSASTEDVSAGAPSVSSDPAGAAPAGLPPDKGPFPCRSCTKSFQSHLQLLHHRRKSHAVERSFHCGVCGKSFKKQIHVRNHLRTHTGERPFQCSDCGKTFSSHANLVRHNLTHSGVRPYHCKVCDRTFSQSSNLRQHSLLHSNAAKLSCPDCPATFRWPSKLATHRYTQHPGAPPPFPCSHCDAGFLTRRQLETHCLDLHTAPVQVAAGGEVGTGHPLAQGVLGGDPSTSEPSTSTAGEGESGASGAALVRGGLDCNICGKKLNSVANMRLHRLSHLAAGPGRPRGSTLVKRPRPKAHQCPVCGKLFVSASGLALHMRVHTGERPFPCTVCGKRFRQNTHLREHLRTHSGERPFCCEVCGKGFIQSMHLSEHRRTHTGERPHSCPLPQCGKTFKTFSNLRNHKKTHARQQRREEEAAARETAVALVDASAVELANGQTQVIHIQTTSLPQTQGTPTIMCNEFGETIAIIETSEGGELPLEQALEIYHRALENGLTMETVAVEGMQLL